MNIIHQGSHTTVTRWEIQEGDRLVWLDTESRPLGITFKIDVMPPTAFVDTVVEDLALAAKALPEIWAKMQEMKEK